MVRLSDGEKSDYVLPFRQNTGLVCDRRTDRHLVAAQHGLCYAYTLQINYDTSHTSTNYNLNMYIILTKSSI